MTLIKFQIHIKVQYGQALYLVNSQLNWQLTDACRMICIKPSLWQLLFDVQDTNFQYKYAISDYNANQHSSVVWEKYPNRIVKLIDDTEGEKKQVEDRWEKRKIIIINPQQYENSLMILLGDGKLLKMPQQMRLALYNGKQYFYKKLWIDAVHLGQKAYYQVYLLIRGKIPEELVSKQICMTITDYKYLISENIQFFKLPISLEHNC